MKSLKVQGENFADSILQLFGPEDSLQININPDFCDEAIEALEDRGCVVQREVASGRFTIYVMPNLHEFQRSAAAVYLSAV